MKKINEVSALAGVTKRTLQYYDDEGLLPVKRTKNNERIYDEESLLRLWQILLYREIGFKLSEIKEILDLETDELDKILAAHIVAMKAEEDRIALQIRIAKKIKEEGTSALYELVFDASHQVTYKRQIEKLQDALINETAQGKEK